MLLYQFKVRNKHKQSLSSTTSHVNGTNQVSKSLQDEGLMVALCFIRLKQSCSLMMNIQSCIWTADVVYSIFSEMHVIRATPVFIMLILFSSLSKQESSSGKKRSSVWLPVYGLARNSLQEPSSNLNGQGQPQKRTDFLFLEKHQCLEYPLLDFNTYIFNGSDLLKTNLSNTDLKIN